MCEGPGPCVCCGAGGEAQRGSRGQALRPRGPPTGQAIASGRCPDKGGEVELDVNVERGALGLSWGPDRWRCSLRWVLALGPWDLTPSRRIQTVGDR